MGALMLAATFSSFLSVVIYPSFIWAKFELYVYVPVYVYEAILWINL